MKILVCSLLASLFCTAAFAQSLDVQKQTLIKERQAKAKAAPGSVAAEAALNAVRCLETAKAQAEIDKCLSEEKENPGDLLKK